MKNKTVFIMVFVLILIILLIALSGRGLETISGYVVKKSNENNPLSFYIVLGALILIAAVLSYIYGVKKFGPA
jgi:predicted nucleic acid-binding Zn ribbon protein